MFAVLVGLVALFALLFVFRVGGAYRRRLLERWPALLLALAALFAFSRGLVWPGVALAVAAGVAWELWPRMGKAGAKSSGLRPPDPADADACVILGVSMDASPDQIRAAYRTKMVRAHPDRGGSHADAARLTAARDRLLRKRR